MTEKEKILSDISSTPLPIIDQVLSDKGFVSIDLSRQNKELATYDIADPEQCQAYIDTFMLKYPLKTAYGGYLEERDLYRNSPEFSSEQQEERCIHLGIDLWGPAGTAVRVPLDGVVHSFADNADPGNYGPTIILEHSIPGLRFFTLYGHLSRESLAGLQVGQPVSCGKKLAEFGKTEENGGYAPHLHFQIIFDLQGYVADYPGVCSKSTLEFYCKNCPDPNLLLKT